MQSRPHQTALLEGVSHHPQTERGHLHPRRHLTGAPSLGVAAGAGIVAVSTLPKAAIRLRKRSLLPIKFIGKRSYLMVKFIGKRSCFRLKFIGKRS